MYILYQISDYNLFYIVYSKNCINNANLIYKPEISLIDLLELSSSSPSNNNMNRDIVKF